MAKGFPSLKVTVSKSSNALYVYVNESAEAVEVDSTDDELEKGVLVDLDKDGNVVGVEFLGIHGKHMSIDAVLDKYATHAEDSKLPVEGAYMLRALSCVEWNLI